MNATLVLSCVLFSALLGCGQLLFKLAADDIRIRASVSWWSAGLSPWLILALLLYALTTGLWLWILGQVQLSRAYPFALLGAALVPVLSAIFLKEQITSLYLVGVAVMGIGILIVQLAR